MKKTITAILIIGLGYGFLVSPVFASQDLVGEVTFEDLEAKEPAILVGNPLHGLKNFRWELERFFLRSKKMTGLKQRILTEKAAEVKKIYTLDTKNDDTLLDALLAYQEKVTKYKIDLASLVASGKKLSNDVDSLDQALTHLRLMDDIDGSYVGSDVKAVLLDIQDQLVQISDILITKMIGVKKVKFALEDLLSDDLIIQIRDWEIITLILGGQKQKTRLSVTLRSYNDTLARAINHKIDNMKKKESLEFEKQLMNLAGTGLWSGLDS